MALIMNLTVLSQCRTKHWCIVEGSFLSSMIFITSTSLSLFCHFLRRNVTTRAVPREFQWSSVVHSSKYSIVECLNSMLLVSVCNLLLRHINYLNLSNMNNVFEVFFVGWLFVWHQATTKINQDVAHNYNLLHWLWCLCRSEKFLKQLFTQSCSHCWMLLFPNVPPSLGRTNYFTWK